MPTWYVPSSKQTIQMQDYQKVMSSVGTTPLKYSQNRLKYLFIDGIAIKIQNKNRKHLFSKVLFTQLKSTEQYLSSFVLLLNSYNIIAT